MVIYKTINLINNKFYIGKDSYNNPEYLGSGLLLNYAIKKYGRHNFKKEILEYCLSIEELNNREMFWIQYYDATNKKIAYNLTDGGSGGDTNKYAKDREERIKKFVKATKIFSKSKRGREIFRKNAKKMWARDGFREKMSNKMKGREILWKEKIAIGVKRNYKRFGTRKVTEEVKQKLSKINKGRQFVTINNFVEKKL